MRKNDPVRVLLMWAGNVHVTDEAAGHMRRAAAELDRYRKTFGHLATVLGVEFDGVPFEFVVEAMLERIRNTLRVQHQLGDLLLEVRKVSLKSDTAIKAILDAAAEQKTADASIKALVLTLADKLDQAAKDQDWDQVTEIAAGIRAENKGVMDTVAAVNANVPTDPGAESGTDPAGGGDEPAPTPNDGSN